MYKEHQRAGIIRIKYHKTKIQEERKKIFIVTFWLETRKKNFIVFFGKANKSCGKQSTVRAKF